MISSTLHKKYSNYRCCIVQECKNTSIKTPNKLWITVPKDTNIRNTWLKIAKKDPFTLSTSSRFYFCEDHFDLPNDMENYTEYRIMGSVKKIQMNPGCVPSKFECQRDQSNQTSNIERPYIKKQRKQRALEECPNKDGRSTVTGSITPEALQEGKHSEPMELESSVKVEIKRENTDEIEVPLPGAEVLGPMNLDPLSLKTEIKQEAESEKNNDEDTMPLLVPRMTMPPDDASKEKPENPIQESTGIRQSTRIRNTLQSRYRTTRHKVKDTTPPTKPCKGALKTKKKPIRKNTGRRKIKGRRIAQNRKSKQSKRQTTERSLSPSSSSTRSAESTPFATLDLESENIDTHYEDLYKIEDEWLSYVDVSDDDDSDLTLLDPASCYDLSQLETQTAVTEDAANNIALRQIAPPDSYEFDWRKGETTFTGQREAFSGTPGPTFNVTTILDTFYRMVDADFVDMLCVETNRFASQVIDFLKSQNKLGLNSRLHRWVPTHRDEMISFLALTILQGLYPLPEEKDYFTSNGFGTMPYFSSIMSYNRYILIKKLMHFVNTFDTETDNKLNRIVPVTRYFNERFSSLYYPSQELVVDETLLKWHGHLNVTQKILSRAGRVGVRTYELCESSSGYLWRFFVCTTKQNVSQANSTLINGHTLLADEEDCHNFDDSKMSPDNATATIVYKLVEPLLDRGHTLIMDSFYNNPLLARCLKRRRTDCYGTLSLYREFVPESLKILTKTDLRRSEVVFGYCSDLTIMVWRDVNLISMISTYPLRNGTRPKCNDTLAQKPSVVLEYNKSIEGLDRKDQFLSAHNERRCRSRVWYRKLFRRIFNTAIFNCYVIYTSGTRNNMSHRQFRTVLAETLLKVHRRLEIKSLSLPSTIAKTRNKHFPAKVDAKSAICKMCYMKKLHRHTIYKCKECNVPLCVLCFEDYHEYINLK